MAAAQDDYRVELVNSILLASSKEQLMRFIDAAIQTMEYQKINKHLIARFVSKVINDLAAFNPVEKQAQQWGNIKIAKILLNRIWIQLNTPAD
jgi:hypothetical protein